MKMHLGILVLFLVSLLVLPVAADDSGAVGYALLVGSNRQGQGQAQLKYAQNDAVLMKSVLTELGKYAPENVAVLIDPGVGELTASLQELGILLAQRAERNEPTVFLFYYSGHARSSGLNFGPDEVALANLREQIEKMPTTVTLIILDACQSGAISNVKGVEPAADFSYNSVEKLNTEGTVVMASSTSSELSQESQELKGSFFTHHLTVGMRGAADTDRNGLVTLSEAYDYAYNTTLRTTAATAVGKQHATLETNLRGKGEMVLTWPVEASSKIELPADLFGEILITHTQSNTVFAEIHKVAGQELSVALRPGKYEALVKLKENEGRKCELTLVGNEISRLRIADCKKIELKQDPVKTQGYAQSKPKPDRVEHVVAELYLGWFMGRQTDYIRTLEDFRYKVVNENDNVLGKIGLTYTLIKYLSFCLAYSKLDDREMTRNLFSGDSNAVDWETRRLGLYVRGNLPLLSAMIVPYVQAGGGFAWSRFRFFFNDSGNRGINSEIAPGYHLAAALGVQLNPWRYVGFTLAEFEYAYAPSLENNLGDVHNSGGLAVMTGIRAGF